MKRVTQIKENLESFNNIINSHIKNYAIYTGALNAIQKEVIADIELSLIDNLCIEWENGEINLNNECYDLFIAFNFKNDYEHDKYIHIEDGKYNIYTEDYFPENKNKYLIESFDSFDSLIQYLLKNITSSFFNINK